MIAKKKATTAPQLPQQQQQQPGASGGPPSHLTAALRQQQNQEQIRMQLQQQQQQQQQQQRQQLPAPASSSKPAEKLSLDDLRRLQNVAAGDYFRLQRAKFEEEEQKQLEMQRLQQLQRQQQQRLIEQQQQQQQQQQLVPQGQIVEVSPGSFPAGLPHTTTTYQQPTRPISVSQFAPNQQQPATLSIQPVQYEKLPIQSYQVAPLPQAQPAPQPQPAGPSLARSTLVNNVTLPFSQHWVYLSPNDKWKTLLCDFKRPFTLLVPNGNDGQPYATSTCDIDVQSLTKQGEGGNINRMIFHFKELGVKLQAPIFNDKEKGFQWLLKNGACVIMERLLQIDKQAEVAPQPQPQPQPQQQSQPVMTGLPSPGEQQQQVGVMVPPPPAQQISPAAVVSSVHPMQSGVTEMVPVILTKRPMPGYHLNAEAVSSAGSTNGGSMLPLQPAKPVTNMISVSAAPAKIEAPPVVTTCAAGSSASCYAAAPNTALLDSSTNAPARSIESSAILSPPLSAASTTSSASLSPMTAAPNSSGPAQPIEQVPLVPVNEVKGIYPALKDDERDRVLTCPNCSRKFFFVSENLLHLKSHYQDPDSVAELYLKVWIQGRKLRCPMDKCKKKMSYTLDYAKHLDTHPAPLLCHLCQLEVESPLDFAEHAAIHHPSVLFAKGTRPEGGNAPATQATPQTQDSSMENAGKDATKSPGHENNTQVPPPTHEKPVTTTATAPSPKQGSPQQPKSPLSVQSVLSDQPKRPPTPEAESVSLQHSPTPPPAGPQDSSEGGTDGEVPNAPDQSFVPSKEMPNVAELSPPASTSMPTLNDFSPEAHTAETPIAPETSPAPLREMPVVTEPSPVPPKGMPIVAEPSPGPQNEVPVVPEASSTSSNEMPIVTEARPIPLKEMPVVTEPSPTPQEDMPLVTEPSPSPQEEMPFVADMSPTPPPVGLPVLAEPCPTLLNSSSPPLSELSLEEAMPDVSDVPGLSPALSPSMPDLADIGPPEVMSVSELSPPPHFGQCKSPLELSNDDDEAMPERDTLSERMSALSEASPQRPVSAMSETCSELEATSPAAQSSIPVEAPSGSKAEESFTDEEGRMPQYLTPPQRFDLHHEPLRCASPMEESVPEVVTDVEGACASPAGLVKDDNSESNISSDRSKYIENEYVPKNIAMQEDEDAFATVQANLSDEASMSGEEGHSDRPSSKAHDALLFEPLGEARLSDNSGSLLATYLQEEGSDYADMDLRLSSDDDDDDDDMGEPQHACSKCGDKFPMAESLRVHQLKCNVPEYACELCQQRFTTTRSLSMHKFMCKKKKHRAANSARPESKPSFLSEDDEADEPTPAKLAPIRNIVEDDMLLSSEDEARNQTPDLRAAGAASRPSFLSEDDDDEGNASGVIKKSSPVRRQQPSFLSEDDDDEDEKSVAVPRKNEEDKKLADKAHAKPTEGNNYNTEVYEGSSGGIRLRLKKQLSGSDGESSEKSSDPGSEERIEVVKKVEEPPLTPTAPVPRLPTLKLNLANLAQQQPQPAQAPPRLPRGRGKGAGGRGKSKPKSSSGSGLKLKISLPKEESNSIRSRPDTDELPFKHGMLVSAEETQKILSNINKTSVTMTLKAVPSPPLAPPKAKKAPVKKKKKHKHKVKPLKISTKLALKQPSPVLESKPESYLPPPAPPRSPVDLPDVESKPLDLPPPPMEFQDSLEEEEDSLSLALSPEPEQESRAAEEEEEEPPSTVRAVIYPDGKAQAIPPRPHEGATSATCLQKRLHSLSSKVCLEPLKVRVVMEEPPSGPVCARMHVSDVAAIDQFRTLFDRSPAAEETKRCFAKSAAAAQGQMLRTRRARSSGQVERAEEGKKGQRLRKLLSTLAAEAGAPSPPHTATASIPEERSSSPVCSERIIDAKPDPVEGDVLYSRSASGLQEAFNVIHRYKGLEAPSDSEFTCVRVSTGSAPPLKLKRPGSGLSGSDYRKKKRRKRLVGKLIIRRNLKKGESPTPEVPAEHQPPVPKVPPLTIRPAETGAPSKAHKHKKRKKSKSKPKLVEPPAASGGESGDEQLPCLPPIKIKISKMKSVLDGLSGESSKKPGPKSKTTTTTTAAALGKKVLHKIGLKSKPEERQPRANTVKRSIKAIVGESLGVSSEDRARSKSPSPAAKAILGLSPRPDPVQPSPSSNNGGSSSLGVGRIRRNSTKREMWILGNDTAASQSRPAPQVLIQNPPFFARKSSVPASALPPAPPKSPSPTPVIVKEPEDDDDDESLKSSSSSSEDNGGDEGESSVFTSTITAIGHGESLPSNAGQVFHMIDDIFEKEVLTLHASRPSSPEQPEQRSSAEAVVQDIITDLCEAVVSVSVSATSSALGKRPASEAANSNNNKRRRTISTPEEEGGCAERIISEILSDVLHRVVSRCEEKTAISERILSDLLTRVVLDSSEAASLRENAESSSLSPSSESFVEDTFVLEEEEDSGESLGCSSPRATQAAAQTVAENILSEVISEAVNAAEHPPAAGLPRRVVEGILLEVVHDAVSRSEQQRAQSTVNQRRGPKRRYSEELPRRSCTKRRRRSVGSLLEDEFIAE